MSKFTEAQAFRSQSNVSEASSSAKNCLLAPLENMGERSRCVDESVGFGNIYSLHVVVAGTSVLEQSQITVEPS